MLQSYVSIRLQFNELSRQKLNRFRSAPMVIQPDETGGKADRTAF